MSGRRSYEPEPPIKACIDLDDIAGRIRMLEVQCNNCGRAGRLSVVRLGREWPADTPLWRITATLNADCPKRTGPNPYDRCRVVCPQMPALFGGEVK